MARLLVCVCVCVFAADGNRWVSWKRLLDASMCLEVHNMTMYPGMVDWIYEMMDREVRGGAMVMGG